MKKIDKQQIVKFAGMALLGVSLGNALVGIAIENEVDHVNELCPLCEVIGLKHQANAANRELEANGSNDVLKAIYYPEEKYSSIKNAVAGKDENGNTLYYSVPEGYVLVGQNAVREVISPERVEIKADIDGDGQFDYTARTFTDSTDVIVTMDDDGDFDYTSHIFLR